MSQFQIALRAATGADVWKKSGPAVEERDIQLLERYVSGDDSAFVELFNTHNHRLYVYTLKLVGNPEAAEDLTQELWEKVLRLRVEGKTIRNPIGFFLTIARNLSLNYLRSRKRLSPLDSLPEPALPFDSLRERSAREEMVLMALAEMPFDYREVLILSAYSGYTLEEIAKMLGKSTDAIWKRASRARAKLSALVVKMIEEENRTIDAMSATGSTAGGGRHDR